MIFLLLCLFGLVFAPWRPASAQSETLLLVLPEELMLFLNDAVSGPVQVYVRDVENLNAFDIALTYEPDLVSVADWSHGGFLSDLTCLSMIDDPGYFRLACSQLAQPGVSGDGALINLTFTGLAEGFSAVTITAATLADDSNPSNQIPAQWQNGSITVGYQSAPVVGSLFLQGRAGHGAVPVSLSAGALFGQGPYLAISTPSLGLNLDFGEVVYDTYMLTTDQQGYLNPAVTINVDGGLTLPPLRLLAGDVLADGQVGQADLHAVREAFGQVGAGLAADINGDGVVDLRDLALVGGNFGLTAEEAYADWLP